MEDLHRPPALAASLPAIAIKAVTALLRGDLTQVADLFTQRQGTLESERSEYLLRCVVDDLRWLRGELHNVTQKQQVLLLLLRTAQRHAEAAGVPVHRLGGTPLRC